MLRLFRISGYTKSLAIGVPCAGPGSRGITALDGPPLGVYSFLRDKYIGGADDALFIMENNLENSGLRIIRMVFLQKSRIAAGFDCNLSFNRQFDLIGF